MTQLFFVKKKGYRLRHIEQTTFQVLLFVIFLSFWQNTALLPPK